jgi:hypothetical protein
MTLREKNQETKADVLSCIQDYFDSEYILKSKADLEQDIIKSILKRTKVKHVSVKVDYHSNQIDTDYLATLTKAISINNSPKAISILTSSLTNACNKVTIDISCKWRNFIFSQELNTSIVVKDQIHIDKVGDIDGINF